MTTKEIGTALKARREALGLSLNSIKIKTDDGKTITRNTLAMLESGEFPGVRLSTVLLYSQYLGLNVEIVKDTTNDELNITERA